jgi:hypothetical protein
MDITPQNETQQPISDDQELAKALAGVMPDMAEPVVGPIAATPEAPMQFEETPAPISDLPTPTLTAPSTAPTDLEVIKKDALEQLRPLIDKVELPAEEKFDIYLMLIRSTDDSSLIGPANIAAQSISDEKRKAEALLDVIKEIDYLSRNQQSAA